MHVYCINLERRPDRREKMEKEFKREDLENVEFISATDGCEHPRMNRGECGCMNSHIRVWQDIVTKGIPWALVFEDDARLVERFRDHLDDIIEQLPVDWDFVNLGSNRFTRIYEKQVTKDLCKGPSVMMHCYLISLKAARQLSQWNLEYSTSPVDIQLIRAPLYKLFRREALSNQNCSNSFFGYIISMFEGSIGAIRTRYSIDFDFMLRIYWPLILFVFYICIKMRFFGL